MPPKRHGVPSSQETRKGTRSQHTAQGLPREVCDAVNSSAAGSGPSSGGSPSIATTKERVGSGRLRPKEERPRGGMKPRRGRRREKQAILEEEVSDVYQDMLRDIIGTSANHPEEILDPDESRPFKKHKVMEPPSSGDKGKGILIKYSEDSAGEAIEDDSNGNNVDLEESGESSDESEADWEEVDLGKQCPLSKITTLLHFLLIS